MSSSVGWPLLPTNGWAKLSAISIFIGAALGFATLAWALLAFEQNPPVLELKRVEFDGGATAPRQDVTSLLLPTWLALVGILAVVQLVIGMFQWKNTRKEIAWLFVAALMLGIAFLLLQAWMMNSFAGNAGFKGGLYGYLLASLIQLSLHVMGLAGIYKLERGKRPATQ